MIHYQFFDDDKIKKTGEINPVPEATISVNEPLHIYPGAYVEIEIEGERHKHRHFSGFVAINIEHAKVLSFSRGHAGLTQHIRVHEDGTTTTTVKVHLSNMGHFDTF